MDGPKAEQPLYPKLSSRCFPARFVPNRIRTGSVGRNLKLLPKPFKSSIFWIAQFGCTIAAASIMIFRIRRRNPKLELRKQKEKLLDGKIREALKHKDTSGFHQALRRKIRLRVGIACDQTNTSALSSSEIINLLRQKQFPENIVTDILNLLKVCDDLEYAQNPNNVTTLELIFTNASTTLKNIK